MARRPEVFVRPLSMEDGLSRCRGPTGIGKTGRRKLVSIAAVYAPRMGDRFVGSIVMALDEQTVIVPGTVAADIVLPDLRTA